MKFRRDKHLISGTMLVGCLAVAGEVGAQGTFRNFDFESAALLTVNPPNAVEDVPVSQAMPGWSVYVGTNRVAQITYNAISLGGPAVCLVGVHSGFGYSAHVIGGRYTAVIQAGEGDFSLATPSAITQSSMVRSPPNHSSLTPVSTSPASRSRSTATPCPSRRWVRDQISSYSAGISRRLRDKPASCALRRIHSRIISSRRYTWTTLYSPVRRFPSRAGGHWA